MNELAPPVPAYAAAAGVFDEHVDNDGQVRPLWSGVLSEFQIPADELRQRRRAAERLLEATGAAHTHRDDVVDDALGSRRVDPIPYLVHAASWAKLQAGIAQRVLLHNAVLDDLYGDNQLVDNRILPVEIARGGYGYQPAAHGWRPVGPRLSRYSADLVRDADGQFVVVAEYTDAPSGLGRALLGRSILSRVMPDVYGASVESLVPFFDAFRATVARLAPPTSAAARAVVLAPSMTDPTYVGHAVLATQLGYNLVTTADLIVQEGKVWLRAIGGREAIDVVVRGVSSDDADSLEISRRGAGVAGLVQSAREGAVGLANTIGSAVSSSPALLPFMPDLCRHFFSDDLELAPAPAVWCRDRETAEQVIADRERYVIHEVVGQPCRDVLTDDALAAAIRQAPRRFVAQRLVPQSTSPVFAAETGVVPGAVMLRVHAVFDGTTVTVLNGGTAQAQAPGGEPMTKDVIVRTGQGATSPRPVVTVAPVDLRASLPSRAAEALFWLGRNAERAEFVARTVRVASVAAGQDPSLRELSHGDWLRRTCTVLRTVSGNHKPVEFEMDLELTIIDALSERDGALANSIRHLVAGAGGVREFLSATTWSVTAALERDRRELLDSDGVLAPEVLDRVLVSLVALAGLTQDSMVRGPSWQFLDVGRRWERAHLLLAGFDAAFSGVADPTVVGPVGEVVLAANESLVAYRRRYRTDVDLGSLEALLLHDDTNPRSLSFQLHRLRDGITALPAQPGLDRCAALISAARQQLSSPSTEPLATTRTVHRLLSEFEQAFTATWFAERRGQTSPRLV